MMPTKFTSRMSHYLGDAIGEFLAGMRAKSASSSVSAFFGLTADEKNPLDPFKDLTKTEQVEAKDKLSVIFRCVGAVSQAVQEAPLVVKEPNVDGEDRVIQDSPLLEPFYSNPSLSYSALMRYISEHLSLCGECFIWKWNSGAGGVNELWPLPPHWVTVQPQKNVRTSEPETRTVAGFKVQVPGQEAFPVDVQDMIYIRVINPATLWGSVSPTNAARNAIVQEERSNRYVGEALTNVPSLVVTTKRQLTQPQKDDLHKVLEEKMGVNARKNALLLSGEGTSVEILTAFDRIDWKNMNQYNEVRVCQVYEVPPLVAGCWVGLENSPWSNTSDAWRYFYQHTVKGRWEMLAEEFTHAIIPHDSRLRYCFDWSHIEHMHEEKDARVTRALQMFHGSLIDRNRALGIAGEDPLPESDPRGSEMVIASNLIPVLDSNSGVDVAMDTEEP